MIVGSGTAQRCGTGQQVGAAVSGQTQILNPEPGDCFVEGDVKLRNRQVTRVRIDDLNCDGGDCLVHVPLANSIGIEPVAGCVEDAGGGGRQSQHIVTLVAGYRSQAGQRPGHVVGRGYGLVAGEQLTAAVAGETEVGHGNTGDRFGQGDIDLRQRHATRFGNDLENRRWQGEVKQPLRRCFDRQRVAGDIGNRSTGSHSQCVGTRDAGHGGQAAERPVLVVGRRQRMCSQQITAAVTSQ